MSISVKHVKPVKQHQARQTCQTQMSKISQMSNRLESKSKNVKYQPYKSVKYEMGKTIVSNCLKLESYFFMISKS